MGVLPDGTLIVLFDNLKAVGHDSNLYDIKAIRSTDGGERWSNPNEVGRGGPSLPTTRTRAHPSPIGNGRCERGDSNPHALSDTGS